MDVIKVAIVFMGAFLGAGFVSGAEVARFFAGKSPFGIILIAIIFAAGFIVYSFSARFNDFDSPYTRLLVKIFSFFSLSATFAVANETGRVLFGIPLAPLTALAALALTSKQKYIKIGATASVAVALTAAVLAAVGSEPAPGAAPVDTAAVGYAVMSAVVPSFAVSAEIKAMRPNKIILTACVIAVLFTLTVFLFLSAIGENGRLISDPGAIGAGFVISAIAVLSAGVTSGGAQLNAAADTFDRRLMTAAVALALSCIGIKNILTFIYPLMAVSAAGIPALSTLFVTKKILVKKRGN